MMTTSAVSTTCGHAALAVAGEAYARLVGDAEGHGLPSAMR